NHVEHTTTGIGSALRINIEDHASLRKRRLHLRNMHRIAPDQQGFVTRTDQTDRVTRRVTRRLQDSHSRKDLSILGETQPVAIRRELLTWAFEKERSVIFAGALHHRVVHPVRVFVRADRQFGIRETRPAVSSVGKPANVVWMDMGQKNSIYRETIDARRTQI